CMQITGSFPRDQIITHACRILSNLLLAIVLNIITWSFIKTEAVELTELCNGRQVPAQNLPDFHDERFTAAQLSGHKVNISIEVLVIELFDHLIADQRAEFFEIDHKTRFRVGVAFDRYNEFKIVPMPV